MRYLMICVLFLLGGCAMPPQKATIKVDLQETTNAVKVVVTYTEKNVLSEWTVTLESQEELDAYKEEAKFLVEKLEEAQNQWEEKAPIPTLHVPSDSPEQMVESEEEFDESVWGPGPSDDMWYPEEEESPQVTWFQGDND